MRRDNAQGPLVDRLVDIYWILGLVDWVRSIPVGSSVWTESESEVSPTTDSIGDHLCWFLVYIFELSQ